MKTTNLVHLIGIVSSEIKESEKLVEVEGVGQLTTISFVLSTIDQQRSITTGLLENQTNHHNLISFGFLADKIRDTVPAGTAIAVEGSLRILASGQVLVEVSNFIPVTGKPFQVIDEMANVYIDQEVFNTLPGTTRQEFNKTKRYGN